MSPADRWEEIKSKGTQKFPAKAFFDDVVEDWTPKNVSHQSVLDAIGTFSERSEKRAVKLTDRFISSRDRMKVEKVNDALVDPTKKAVKAIKVGDEYYVIGEHESFIAAEINGHPSVFMDLVDLTPAGHVPEQKVIEKAVEQIPIQVPKEVLSTTADELRLQAAVEQIEGLGIRVTAPPTNPELAELAARELASLHSKGQIPENLTLKFYHRVSEKSNVAEALLGQKDVSIGINEAGEFWENSADLLRSGKKPWFNWDRPGEAIVHEIGHARHGVERFNEYLSSKSLTAAQKQIALRVSRYAATNSAEYVAEVYTGLIRGEQFSQEILSLYQEFNGPALEETRDALLRRLAKSTDPADAKRFYNEIGIRSVDLSGEGAMQLSNRVAEHILDNARDYPGLFTTKPGELPWRIEFISPPYPGKPMAYFSSAGRRRGDDFRTLGFNPTHSIWKQPDRYASLVQEGWFTPAGSVEKGIVDHEVTHALHYKTSPHDFRFLKQLTPAQKRTALEISRYAAADPIEFVAETGCAIRQGTKVSKKVLDLYEEFGGPPIKSSL